MYVPTTGYIVANKMRVCLALYECQGGDETDCLHLGGAQMGKREIGNIV